MTTGRNLRGRSTTPRNRVLCIIGERGHDREHGAPHGRARVEALAVAHELDAERLELVESAHEMPHASREAIEPVDEDHVERALPRAVHQAIELWPVIARAAHAVINELGDDLDRSPRGVLSEHVELHLRALARERRDSGIDCRAHHDGIFRREPACTPRRRLPAQLHRMLTNGP